MGEFPTGRGQKLELNWRSGFFRLWIAASLCWVIFSAVMAYENVVVPQQKVAADISTCIIDHGVSACSRNARLAAGEPPLPNPYVPYVILAVSGLLAMLFACLGVAWIREGLKTEPDGPEV